MDEEEQPIEEPAPKKRKSELTREKIVTSALELFEDQGFDNTTMRAIAERAGVSLGNAYYYFPSKEDLMQGFYESLLVSFSERVQPILERERSFGKRLSLVLTEWVDNARPHHEFSASFFRYAANPTSPLSPFSAESTETREASTEIYRQVIEGSQRLKLSGPMQKQLPEMLWLYQMGIVLFWVFDQSHNQAKTVHLIERTVPMITKLVNLAKIPGLRNVANDFTKLFGELRGATELPQSK